MILCKLILSVFSTKGNSSFANKIPKTSSLFSPITGKRECFVSEITGNTSLNFALMSTAIILARGIIMSRTFISETCNTPSIIARDSPSNK